jgi:hypothetical protein
MIGIRFASDLGGRWFSGSSTRPASAHLIATDLRLTHVSGAGYVVFLAEQLTTAQAPP